MRAEIRIAELEAAPSTKGGVSFLHSANIGMQYHQELGR
jgi:hypothetical protein